MMKYIQYQQKYVICLSYDISSYILAGTHSKLVQFWPGMTLSVRREWRYTRTGIP